MNSEKLHDAMNYIDDELIEETNRRRQKKPVNKRIVLRALSCAAAACFYICIIIAVIIIVKGNHRRYNAGLIGNGSKSDKDILVVTDSIDEETSPSATQAPTKKPSQTSLATEVPDATFDNSDSTSVPDEEKPLRSPQKTPNATSVPKETSPREDESDVPIDATELPQEPTYSLKYVIVEVLSLNNGRFDCIGTRNDAFSEIKDGEIIEIIAEDSSIASDISQNIRKTIKVYFSKYDYEGHIIADYIEEVDL